MEIIRCLKRYLVHEVDYLLDHRAAKQSSRPRTRQQFAARRTGEHRRVAVHIPGLHRDTSRGRIAGTIGWVGDALVDAPMRTVGLNPPSDPRGFTQFFDEQRYTNRHQSEGDGCDSYASRQRSLACRPLTRGPPTAPKKACRTTAPIQPAHQAPSRTDPPRCYPGRTQQCPARRRTHAESPSPQRGKLGALTRAEYRRLLTSEIPAR
jgi:hypothetical protein